MKWTEGNCVNCGECCIEYPTMRFIFPDEWERILGYIREEHDGVLLVTFFNHTIQRYLTVPFEPAIDDFSVEAPLFGVLNEVINPCPFLRFDMGEARYYCDIQEIKPEACKDFFCEPHGVTSRLNREHILNFGRSVEYPQCKECAEYNFAFQRPRYEGEATECERGEGCRFLERRVNYLLRYAKGYSGQNGPVQFARKLIKILTKQDEVFKRQLNSDLGLRGSQIEFNKDKYVKMIEDINMVIDLD